MDKKVIKQVYVSSYQKPDGQISKKTPQLLNQIIWKAKKT